MTLPGPEQWLVPDWAVHPRVRALVTTRKGEHSPPPWHGFNLGAACGDDPQRVAVAREHVHRRLGTVGAPLWLDQTHGTAVIHSSDPERAADGAWTDCSQVPCVVLTADCLPVLVARQDGSRVGAFHAGWRGLLGGILERGVGLLAPGREPLSAWIGPAVCGACYQVDDALRDVFLARDARAAPAFRPDGPGHWRLDLAAVARQRLAAAGVVDVGGGRHCTHCQSDSWYSFRHEGRTGRFASLIWLKD